MTELADQIFAKLMQIPFLSKFVVFARRTSPTEARVRLLCLTDDKVEKTLEKYEKYKDVAQSASVQVDYFVLRRMWCQQTL